MADTDLTSTILGYTDRHLGLPLLSHLADLETFNKDDIAKATYDLVRGTSMWDYAISLHEQAFPGQAPPADLVKQSEEQQSVLERLTAEADRVLTVIEDPTLVDSLKQDKAQNLHYLEEKYQVRGEEAGLAKRCSALPWKPFGLTSVFDTFSPVAHRRPNQCSLPVGLLSILGGQIQ